MFGCVSVLDHNRCEQYLCISFQFEEDWTFLWLFVKENGKLQMCVLVTVAKLERQTNVIRENSSLFWWSCTLLHPHRKSHTRVEFIAELMKLQTDPKWWPFILVSTAYLPARQSLAFASGKTASIARHKCIEGPDFLQGKTYYLWI